MSNLTRVLVPMGGLILGSSVLGAVAMCGAPAAEPIAVSLPIPAPIMEEHARAVTQIVAPPDRRDARQYGFVMRVDGETYVQIAADGKLPHGRVRAYDDDGVHSAVATVGAQHLPVALRDWIDKRVVVDGTCQAKVVGFAAITRVTGYLAYAGGIVDADGASPEETNWTAAQITKASAPVLAAKLDGCTGTWARDAALPPAAEALPVPMAADLGARVRADLATTEAAATERAQWATDWADQDYAKHFHDAALELHAVIHPVLGTRWVFAHLSEGETCGAPNLNLVGVYRVRDDGSLDRVAAYESEIVAIDQLIDVDGDGRFEMRTTTGLVPQSTFDDLDNSQLSESEIPYFGCPC